MGFKAIEGGGTAITGNNSIQIFRLLSMKARVKLEKVGMRSSVNVTALMRKELGLKARAPHDDVIAAIEAKVKEMEPASKTED